MFWQPGPSHWDAADRAVEKTNLLRSELEKKDDEYLKGVVDMGMHSLRWMKFLIFLKSANPFLYGGDYFYEKGALYELSREILAERNLKDADTSTLIREGKKTFIDRLYPFYESKSDSAVKRRTARELLNRMIPKRQERLFDFV